MNIFLSGSKGYIARNLIPFLNIRGYKIVGFDIEEGNNINDAPVVIAASRSCDAIIHLGAIVNLPYCEKHPWQAININILGTMNICQAAKLHKIPIIFASTFAAKNPTSMYGLTKRIGEKLVLDANGVVIRLANIYGGEGYLENKTNAVANFMNKKAMGERAIIHGDGSTTRDFTHIIDVCKAFLAGLDAESGIYEACTGVQTSILELAKMVGVHYEFTDRRLGDVKQLKEKPNFIPGWEPTVTLENGLRGVMR